MTTDSLRERAERTLRLAAQEGAIKHAEALAQATSDLLSALALLRDECAALRADAERLDSFERMDLSLVQREPGCWSCAEGLKDHVVWATSPRAAIDAIRKGMVGALAGKPPAARATGATPTHTQEHQQ